MQIQIPRLVQPLPLADYAPELGAVTIFVWVNPPIEFLRRRETLTDDEIDAWWVELWSQGSDPGTRWTAEDLQRLITETSSTDPGLWPWLARRTWELIGEHRAAAKKG